MGTLVRVTVNDTNINRLFLPGGDGWSWMQKVGQEQMFITLEQTPVRSGELRRSLNLALTPNGRNNVRYTVGSYSETAIYVIFGTKNPIYGSGSYMKKSTRLRKGQIGYQRGVKTMSIAHPLMMVRPQPHSWFDRPTPMRFVDGQMANDFMGRAGQIIYNRYA